MTEFDTDPKATGVLAGYNNPDQMPKCPYPLYAEKRPDQIRRSRHPDRDAWMTGFAFGRRLARKHKVELDTLLVHTN